MLSREEIQTTCRKKSISALDIARASTRMALRGSIDQEINERTARRVLHDGNPTHSTVARVSKAVEYILRNRQKKARKERAAA